MTDRNANGVVTELRARGYSVLPAPRQVELTGGTVSVSYLDWGVKRLGVAPGDIAMRTLLDLDDGIGVVSDATKPKQIELAVRPGTVKTGTGDGRDEQAYAIDIADDGIRLVGNGPPGLFYAVQTLLQLAESGGGELPLARIVDWPQYELRIVHWDTKHHRDRIATLKRYLDQAARFKINGILFELEDRFEYPSHPVIGAPGAFTLAEMQDLTRYALERHIEMIPDVQAPAHMCYVLKHSEFAHLRCDGSNYQICMDEPEARKLIFDMYDDVCEATPDCKYFHVSTDEVYYAGICAKHRRPYNPENRSLTWVDFVNAAHAHLAKKGRKVIIWAEFPLLDQHVKLLPADILDGIGRSSETRSKLAREHGIRQFAYASMQGEELLFPNYFGYVDKDGRPRPGRLATGFEEALRGGATKGNPIGCICTTWDDAGLHDETFWLGWAAMAAFSWTPGVSVEETAATFFDIFYGNAVDDMGEVYRDLQSGVRFFEHTLEHLPSKVRGPAYGYSAERRPVNRTDRTLVPPALPDPNTLAIEPVFRARYAGMLAEAPERLAESDRLLLRLQGNLGRVTRNGYNLEVLISLARFARHFVEMLLGVAGAEDLLVAAAKEGDPKRAVGLLVDARRKVRRITDDLHETYERLKAAWEKGCLPKNAPAGGREFVHVMDDVKDHFADRRADLSYLIAPEEGIGLAAWLKGLAGVIAAYGAAHGLRVKGSEEKPMDA